jgi:glycosyltransferase involved in cell wall biosynthesis
VIDLLSAHEIMPRLSVCTIALNEEAMISGMLASVQGTADEIIIGLDTRTTDTTREIAERFGVSVINIEWQDDFSRARNITLRAATGDWILVLDADERLTPAGAKAVQDVLACAPTIPAPDAVTGLAFTLAQCNLQGKLLGWGPSSARLFRRRPEIRYRGRIHEEPTWLPDPSITTTGYIYGQPSIVHYGYDDALWEGRGKQERNVRLLEQRVAENPDDDYARAKLVAQKALTFER